MRVKTGDRICIDARAKAEAIEDLLFHDYYSRTPRLRLTAETEAEAAIEVVLEDSDVAKLVECALRHPSVNMRQVVLAAIWNDAAAFRDILRFGLRAPEPFLEIRRVVAEEVGSLQAPPAAPTASPATTLLPKLPLPPHLRRGGKG